MDINVMELFKFAIVICAFIAVCIVCKCIIITSLKMAWSYAFIRWPIKCFLWICRTIFRKIISFRYLKREPWTLQPYEFNWWYEREIVDGLSDFKEECGWVIDEIVQVIYQHMTLNVKEVIKGGSLGKETLLQGLSDFQCVIFIHPPAVRFLRDVRNLSSYAQYDLANAIEKIENIIQSQSTVVSKHTNKYMVTATLVVSGVEVKVDMLPTADNLTAEGIPSLYYSMLRQSGKDRELYSASLIKLQIDFIKEKPGVVKELIRLVEYWNKRTVRDALQMRRGLPTSYPMELITVYAWQNVDCPSEFSLLKGFKHVLFIIGYGLDHLRHYWTTNYTSSIAEEGIKLMDGWFYKGSRERPLILDPANPTKNVCAKFHHSWDDVAKVARETLQTSLLQNVKMGHNWQ